MQRRIAAAAALLLGMATSACGGGLTRIPDDLGLYTRQDTIRDAGARVYSAVTAVDDASRTAGALPSTLDGLAHVSADPWGRAMRYAPAGRAYEIRSAGRDSAFETADDIVATARLGRRIPCEMRDENVTTHWDNVAPRCEAGLPDTVSPLCPALNRADWVERETPATRRDSVLATGRRLVRVARALDGLAASSACCPRACVGP